MFQILFCEKHTCGAARQAGMEDVYKIYAERFAGENYLRRMQTEAQAIVDAVLAGAAVNGYVVHSSTQSIIASGLANTPLAALRW